MLTLVWWWSSQHSFDVVLRLKAVIDRTANTFEQDMNNLDCQKIPKSAWRPDGSVQMPSSTEGIKRECTELDWFVIRSSVQIKRNDSRPSIRSILPNFVTQILLAICTESSFIQSIWLGNRQVKYSLLLLCSKPAFIVTSLVNDLQVCRRLYK